MVLVKIEIPLDVLHEIMNNSVNPKVAMDLLNEVYIAPDIPIKSMHSIKGDIMTLTYFDKWKNKVSYTTPKFRWYNDTETDWNGSRSPKYTIKKEFGVNHDDMPVEEWMSHVHFLEKNVVDSEHIVLSSRMSEFVDQEMNPSID